MTIDPLNTETSNFWQNHGEFNEVDPSQIQTEVFRLPSTCFAEENGSIVNSGRWLQWHWKGGRPGRSAERRRDPGGHLQPPARDVCARRRCGARTGAEHDLGLPDAGQPGAGRGGAGKQRQGAGGSTGCRRQSAGEKGELLSSFAQLRDDGTTASGCWIFAGSWTPAGNQMARRDNADPSGLGNTLGWAWAWPLNRRILYNRASADPQGKPWDPKRQLLEWTAPSGSGPISRTTAPPRRAATSGRSSCSRKAWAACSPPTRWRKGRS